MEWRGKEREGERKLLYLHPKLSLGLVPYITLYSKVDVACKKIIIIVQAAMLLILLANQAQTVTDNGMNKDTVLLTTNLLITT